MTEQKILIIDTCKEMIQRITSQLEAAGYPSFSAHSGESGIDLSKKWKPSLIFVNAGISAGMRGLQICKTLHETEGLDRIPIIILTPRDIIITDRDTSLYGIVDYLTYAFVPEELLRKTKSLLPLYRQEGESPHEEPRAAEQEPHVEASGQVQEPLTEQISSEPDRQTVEAAHLSPLPGTDSLAEGKISLALKGETERKDYDRMFEKKRFLKSILLGAVMVLLTVLGAGGIIFYDDLLRLPILQKPEPDVVKSSAFSEQQAALTRSPQDPEKQHLEEKKAVASQDNEPIQRMTKENKESPPPHERREKQVEALQKKLLLPSVVKPSAPANGTCSVQVGVFKNETNAAALARELKARGHQARVHKEKTNKDASLYRVLLGRFEKEEDARKLADKLRTDEKLSAVLFRE
ncbi:MAG: SPOR domain-containing protein [Nitrospirota bacterium]